MKQEISGWICPKCKLVNAPTNAVCIRCVGEIMKPTEKQTEGNTFYDDKPELLCEVKS